MKTNIKTSDLIKYPFPQIKCDGLFEFEYILNALNIEYYNLDDTKFNVDFFTIKKIYNNPHNSDEDSFRNLLFFKNEFVCLYGYTGDRGSETIEFASLEKKIELRNYFLSLLNEDNDNSDILPDEYNFSDSYTTFFEKDNEFYYHINDPYNSFCFKKHMDLIYVDEKDNFTPVKFIKMKLDDFYGKNIFESFKKENHFMTVQKEDNTEIEVPFENIIFKVK